ncbi:MAG: MFS transporter [Deltaproteobacteria bacterium]|nr:MFS transporter [Deltaproteobacteria bacterium]
MEVNRQAPRKIFWGWYVVAGAFITVAINYGSRYSFGVFLKPMCEDLGWSRSVVSFAMSLYFFFYGVGGVISGRLLDLFAPRWVIVAGSSVMAAGFFLTPFISTPLQLYLVYGVVCGISSAFFGSVVGIGSVGKWFIRKRGLAIGITSMGIGFGTMLLTPLAGTIVKYFDWKTAFFVLAAAIFLVCTVLSQYFMGKRRPEDYGLLADGAMATPQPAPAPPLRAGKLSYRETTRILMKDSRFWIINICFGFATMSVMTVFAHQVPYVEEYGIDPIVAAATLGVIAVASIAGRFFFGWLSDRLGDPRHSACLGFACMALAMIILLFFHSLESFYLYACLFGFGYGSLTAMYAILNINRFGTDISGTAIGLTNFFGTGLGGCLGPIFGGIIYDTMGSYTFAWQVNLGVLLGVTALIQFLKPALAPAALSPDRASAGKYR